MKKRLPAHAIGDAAIKELACQREKGWPGDTVTWGDCGTLDNIVFYSGFHTIHPDVHTLDRHRWVLNALEHDARFEKFLFRCVDSNGIRETHVRAFRLVGENRMDV